MKRFLALLGSLMLVAATAPDLSAQSLTKRAPAGPTIEAARVGVVAPAVAASPASASSAEQMPSRESAALMIVGGAALLAGLLIGGDAGTAIAVGGALLGLYGLWMYVR